MAISTDLKSVEARTTRRFLRNQNRRGFAFLIEALIVLAFLMGCLAVFVRLFSAAQLEGLAATRLSEAVVVATNRAEEFSANPTNTSGATTENDLRVECKVKKEPGKGGTLFKATIVVHDERNGDAEIFSLETSRYMSGVVAGDPS